MMAQRKNKQLSRVRIVWVAVAHTPRKRRQQQQKGKKDKVAGKLDTLLAVTDSEQDVFEAGGSDELGPWLAGDERSQRIRNGRPSQAKQPNSHIEKDLSHPNPVLRRSPGNARIY
jgi:hypothetical protein